MKITYNLSLFFTLFVVSSVMTLKSMEDTLFPKTPSNVQHRTNKNLTEVEIKFSKGLLTCESVQNLMNTMDLSMLAHFVDQKKDEIFGAAEALLQKDSVSNAELENVIVALAIIEEGTAYSEVGEQAKKYTQLLVERAIESNSQLKGKLVRYFPKYVEKSSASIAIDGSDPLGVPENNQKEMLDKIAPLPAFANGAKPKAAYSSKAVWLTRAAGALGVGVFIHWIYDYWAKKTENIKSTASSEV